MNTLSNKTFIDDFLLDIKPKVRSKTETIDAELWDKIWSELCPPTCDTKPEPHKFLPWDKTKIYDSSEVLPTINGLAYTYDPVTCYLHFWVPRSRLREAPRGGDLYYSPSLSWDLRKTEQHLARELEIKSSSWDFCPTGI